MSVVAVVNSVFVYVSSVVLSSCTLVAFPFQLGDLTL